MPGSRYHDVGSLIDGVLGVKPYTATAGSSTTDNVALTGTAIDRHDNNLPLSCKILAPYAGSLAATKTATITVAINDSSSTASFSSFSSSNTTIGTTGSTAAQTLSGIIELDVDLGTAKRYLQGSITTNLSATATDTVIIGSVIALGGGNQLPE